MACSAAEGGCVQSVADGWAVRCFPALRGTLAVIMTPQEKCAAVMVINGPAGWHALVDSVTVHPDLPSAPPADRPWALVACCAAAASDV